MTHRVVGLGFGLLFLLVQLGCNDIVTPPPSGGGGGGNGGGGIDVCSDEGGPAVAILLPTPASDPNTDTLVTDPSLSVECEVTATDALVDDSSVTIIVRDDDGGTETPVVVNNGDGTYSASLDLGSYPNGTLSVACEASDSSAAKSCSSATVMTFLDLGPSVVILSPDDGSVQAGGMDVEFTIAADPVSDSDTLAEPDLAGTGSLIVAGAQITNIINEAGVLVGTVDFDDPALYQTPLNGAYEFSVSVANDRGVTRRETRSFTVDAGGPTINIIEPELASIIAGATNVIAEITDPSGVDASTVRYRIDAQEFSMTQIGGTNRFTGSFDANQYPETIGQITINVTAADLSGNDRTEEVSVQLDSRPPLIDMDPPTVREAQEEMTAQICSTAFDPVGGEAANDATVLGPVPSFRARIEDRTNRVSAISGVNNDDVQVYILDDETQPLLIDADGDGVCDSINPDFLPNNPLGNQPAVVIDMTAVAASGNAFFQALAAGQSLPNPYNGSPFCFGGDNGNGTGKATDPPDDVCLGTNLTRVIPDNTDPDGLRPAIYGRAPLTPLRCIGDRFDFPGAGINPGFACVAARATDNGGNGSVSSPLRVCLDDLLGGSDCPAVIGNTFVPAFSCTSGCTVSELDFVEDSPNTGTLLNSRLIGPFQ
ncbi:MAG: hypothetical protein WBB42_11315 [Polyangiales bacterium]